MDDQQAEEIIEACPACKIIIDRETLIATLNGLYGFMEDHGLEEFSAELLTELGRTMHEDEKKYSALAVKAAQEIGAKKK